MVSNPISDGSRLTERSGIWSLSFQGLLWTQFLTAINDNVFRWFVIGVGKDQFLPESQSTLLILGSAFFIVPYILFASVAGWLADRFPKRHVIVCCKVAEILIMTFGTLAVLGMGKPNPSVGLDPLFYLLLGTVFLMGTQSALFSPAKIGTIPEMLNERTIARGNGLFNLVTLTATIIGMALGGWLSDHTLKGQQNIGSVALVLIGLAVAGTVFSFYVRSLAAANPLAKFPVTLIGETLRDLRLLFQHKTLFPIALGISFFWSIAAFAQLNIDFFSAESGGLTESDRTPLLIAVTLGIGLGSVLAGYLSLGRIELGLVPLGAIGVVLFSLLLAFAPPDFITESLLTPSMIIGCLFLFGLGVAAGTFDVPLESYLQHHSPIALRGRLLAATNCLAFGGILLMFGLLQGMRTPVSPGSLDNLPVELTANSLNPQQQTLLQELRQEYRQQLIEKLQQQTVADAGEAGATTAVDSATAVDWPIGLKVREFADRFATNPHFRDVVIVELSFLDRQIREPLKKSLPFSDYLLPWHDLAKNPLGTSESRDSGDLITSIDPAALGSAAISNGLQRSEAVLVRKGTTQAGKLPLLSSRQIFLAISLISIPVMILSIWSLGRPFVRLLFWFLVKLLYRVKVTGLESFPSTGPVVVVANHSSWLDGVVMLVLIPRIPRTIAWAGNFQNILMKKWADFCGVILITGGPKSIRRGLMKAREVLTSGEVLGIFPEGGISATGQVRTFKPGLTKIIDKDDPVPIVPVYIDETYGSLFSYSKGKLFRKLPDRLRRPLSVQIGEPIHQFESMFQLQQAVQRLGANAVDNHAGKFIPPAKTFIQACKRQKFSLKIADSTHQEAKGGALLTRCLVLRRLLKKFVLDADESHVGVLIPPSLGGVVVNMSLALDKRVAVNLNYTLSNDLINTCIRKAGIKHVLTSRKVMEKFDFQLDCEVVYLDDLREKVSTVDKLLGALGGFLMPGSWLASSLGLNRLKPDDLLTIVFTSGSTGVPKGVMLTHRNIATNVQAIEQVAAFKPTDNIVGILPFFHSMGYTATLWAPMICNIKGVYHFSPLDAQVIGKLIEKYRGTFIIGTPTFLRTYCRRCKPEQLKTLEVVVAGAERLPLELSDEFEQKFGVRPVEGFGTTELSPITAVNIPPSRQRKGDFQTDCKEGTVGRPIPNVAAKITDLDTGAELGPNESGMLWVKGPNVMKGYLDMPQETAEVIVDGWYKTGDVAMIDQDGFIKITGRMSRFSKIGGEMVPHLKIEEVLTAFLDQQPDDESDSETLPCAITAVADARKGERLIVLHTTTSQTVDAMIAALKEADLPNLFIPSADSFFQVDSIPILGTGKIDLKGIKDLALNLTEQTN